MELQDKFLHLIDRCSSLNKLSGQVAISHGHSVMHENRSAQTKSVNLPRFAACWCRTKVSAPGNQRSLLYRNPQRPSHECSCQVNSY
jgi:hypothetical protein